MQYGRPLILLAAGYLVVRMREDALPSLEIAMPATWSFASTQRRLSRRKAMEEISAWLDTMELARA